MSSLNLTFLFVERKERNLALKHKEVLPSHFAGYVRHDDNKKLNRQRHEWIYKLRTKKKNSFPRSMNRHFVRSTKEERSEGLTSQ